MSGSPGLRINRSLVPFGWNLVFSTRRQDIDYNSENRIHIETLQQATKVDVAQDRPESEEEEEEEESVVQLFMHGEDESDGCFPQADKVNLFCQGEKLESLQSQEDLTPVALLDEIRFEKGNRVAKEDCRPLTARELYYRLKKAHFDSSSHPDESDPGTSQHEPDAERRSIFITDLDRWSILALMGTASESQAIALRSAIYKHLAFETLIAVIFSSNGLSMFQLAFHVPYYALRSRDSPITDHRRYANGDQLRHSQNVSFLNPRGDDTPCYLYEAQASCVVTGFEESRCVAYCFVDTYFDTFEGGKESVTGYHNDGLRELGMHADPFLYGRFDADKPLPNPRDFFLRVLQVRLEVVHREWVQVVETLTKSVRDYEQTHPYNAVSLARTYSSPQEATSPEKDILKDFDWVVQVKRLSTKLSLELSKTVDACDGFSRNYAVAFSDRADVPAVVGSLSILQTTFIELDSQRKILENLAVLCDHFTVELNLHLNRQSIEVANCQRQLTQKGLDIAELQTQLAQQALEIGNCQQQLADEQRKLAEKALELSELQRQLAKDSKGMSVAMMMYVSPALAAGIFSMKDTVLPFLPANFVSFLILVLLFWGVAMVAVHPYPARKWGVSVAFVKVTCRKLQAREMAWFWRSKVVQDTENQGPGTVSDEA